MWLLLFLPTLWCLENIQVPSPLAWFLVYKLQLPSKLGYWKSKALIVNYYLPMNIKTLKTLLWNLKTKETALFYVEIHLPLPWTIHFSSKANELTERIQWGNPLYILLFTYLLGVEVIFQWDRKTQIQWTLRQIRLYMDFRKRICKEFLEVFNWSDYSKRKDKKYSWRC